MIAVTRSTVVGAAALGAVGATVLTALSVGLLGEDSFWLSGLLVTSAQVLAAVAAAIIAAWFAQGHDGPAGVTAVFAALLAAAVVGSAALIPPAALGGILPLVASRTGPVAMAVFLLAIGGAAADDRLTSTGQRVAAFVGAISVGATLLPVLRPAALLGLAAWFAWLAVHLTVRVGGTRRGL